MVSRPDGRKPDALRRVRVIRNYIKHAEGSVLIECGETKVICAASVEDKVPPFLKGTGSGWITAEYGMLPRSTHTRNVRDVVKGYINGRSQEIQRLIGRSLRAVVDLHKLGERTIWIDCDVIQADGGTRTASITGAFIALYDAINYLIKTGAIKENPIKEFMAAVSVGVYKGVPILDLNFQEDSEAEVDMNVVMTESGSIVEIQGTAEKKPFDKAVLDKLLELAWKGIKELITFQKKIILDKKET